MPGNKDVMVLDDEHIVGDRLRPALEQEGFQVEVFTDSKAAIDRLKELRAALISAAVTGKIDVREETA